MKKGFYNFALHIYFSLRTWWSFWFYILNYKNRKLLEKNRPSLNHVQKRVLADLEKDGIATAPLSELFPKENLLEVLRAYARGITHKPEINPRKPYLHEYWSTTPTLDFANPFVKISLSNIVLDITTAYLQMFVKFKTFNLNEIFAVPKESEEAYSQQWHRDPQEKRMCKMFIYLTDVGEKNGPFIYIPQSVYGKKWGHLFPQKTPLGSYPKKEDLEKIIPKENWRAMTAPAGTVIFCDTTGLHKGGFVQEGSRLMYTAFYSAPSFKESAQYITPANISDATLSPTGKFAIRP